MTVVSLPDYLPIKEVFYDEDMEVARTLDFKNIKLLGGRRMPSVLRMTPMDKPGEFTEVIYESLKFNIGIKDSFFSLNQLRRKY